MNKKAKPVNVRRVDGPIGKSSNQTKDGRIIAHDLAADISNNCETIGACTTCGDPLSDSFIARAGLCDTCSRYRPNPPSGANVRAEHCSAPHNLLIFPIRISANGRRLRRAA
jgi:hypothetical protein